jgi:AraC family transcriptional regulator
MAGIKPSGRSKIMKRSVRIISPGLLFFLFILSTLPSASVAGQAQSGAITIQESEAFVYVCLEQQGSFEGIQDAIGRLVQEMQAQNLVPSGPLLGIYRNSPEEVSEEDLRWEVGFPVTAQAFIQAPLIMKEWNYTESTVCLHRGSYEDTGKTIGKMLDWMDANGYRPAGPIMEMYLDMNPEGLRPEQLRAEIRIPCQKKG